MRRRHFGVRRSQAHRQLASIGGRGRAEKNCRAGIRLQGLRLGHIRFVNKLHVRAINNAQEVLIEQQSVHLK